MYHFRYFGLIALIGISCSGEPGEVELSSEKLPAVAQAASSCPAGTVKCSNSTTALACSGGVWKTLSCAAGTSCEGGSCVGPISWHASKSVDLQFVQNFDPSQFAQCTTPAEDRASWRLLCDVGRTINTLRPRFGLFFGNGWFSIDPNSTDPCARLPLNAALDCLGARLKQTADRLHAEVPELLLSGQIAEYVSKGNVSPTQWPGICQPGTIGMWGPDTCIPDVIQSQDARSYLKAWGRAFIDGGIRALLFGQARALAGSQEGTNYVSYAGAVALKEIMDDIRAYASSKGIPRVYFGAQAASSLRLTPDGAELLDYVMGAQHLEVLGKHLLQPLLGSGPFITGIYGTLDQHDANISNNANGLPVVLDYDNWSWIPEIPDDIRRLAQISTIDERRRTLIDHFRHLRLYNPNASLSIPVSKTLGDATGVQCQGINRWHFSAEACGLVDTAKALFDESEVASPFGRPILPIDRAYWGQQLRGRDEMVSWLYRVLLNRQISPWEYGARVGGFSPIIDMAIGPRCNLTQDIVASAEFTNRQLDNSGFVDTIYRAILLREPDAGGGAYWTGWLTSGSGTRTQLLQILCSSPEASWLYAPM